MIRTRKPEQKKLCPRCGSPMMVRENGVKYCPVCHYTEGAQKTEIAIKISEDEVKKELPKIEIYRVSASGVSKVPNLDSKSSCLVADRNSNTIWVWKGSQSSPGEAYKASVESTRLKSSLKMYSASIIRIEEGDEPANFPKIGADQEAKERDRIKKEEEDLKLQKEVRQRKEQEDQRRQLEEARKQKEAEELRLKEEEARRKMEDEDRRRQIEENRKQKEAEERRLREEEARKRKEAEAYRLLEEQARKRQEIEERRLREEEAHKRKEEERRLREEEEHKRKEEEERRLREEEERRARERKVSASELLEKPASEVKPSPEVEEEIDLSKDAELKEAIASLTLVRGITKEIAIKLFKANISTIMELSLSDPENLTASGLSLDTLQQIIRNAKDLLGLD